MARFWMLQNLGVIKRFGVVVRHHELGYRANAMVVWDIPDERVRDIGQQLGDFAFVTLCYRRPRRLPVWPYNLFTMIHGRDREQVLARVEELVQACGLGDVARDVLFSQRRFKQRGARYGGGGESRPGARERPVRADGAFVRLRALSSISARAGFLSLRGGLCPSGRCTGFGRGLGARPGALAAGCGTTEPLRTDLRCLTPGWRADTRGAECAG